MHLALGSGPATRTIANPVRVHTKTPVARAPAHRRPAPYLATIPLARPSYN